MWQGYTTREAAQFVGLPESAVRGCVRAGLVATTAAAEDVPLRLSFRDLSVLKAVKALMDAGIPWRRVRRQLTALQKRLPGDSSLAELSLAAHDGHVLVREHSRAWRADTGQMILGFADSGRSAGPESGPNGQIYAIPVRREARGPTPVASMSAEDWFERAVALEEEDVSAAMDAYERSLRLRQDCTEAWINLGRLYAETGNTERATSCFRQALTFDPGDATALYNLGVVAQDAGRDDEAITHYQRALRIDATLAEAHYNLATIFDRKGDTRAAIRHINEYRKLTRKRG